MNLCSINFKNLKSLVNIFDLIIEAYGEDLLGFHAME